MGGGVRFIPVRGTEAKIKAMPPKDGTVYFATDTNKIYLDSGSERVPMGGSGASLYYTNQAEVPANEETALFTLNHQYFLDDSVYPNIDDLIINSDGSFYRVQDIADDEYICTRMALSGGGGGGSLEPINLSLTIDSATLKTFDKLVYAQDYFVNITAVSTVDDYVTLMFEFTGDGGYSNSFSRAAQSNKAYKLNLNFLPINKNIKMKVSATSDNFNKGENYPSKTVSGIEVIDLRIDKPAGAGYIAAQTSDLQLRYIPYGKGLGAQLKTAVDGVEINNSVTLIDDNFENAQTVGIPVQAHGTHTIELWLSATINGTVLNSSKISYEASWIDQTNETPVIWTGAIDPVIVLYENAVIPYMVYDVNNERTGAKTTVNFFKNGALLRTEEVSYSSSGWYYWDVTTYYELGLNEFVISCGATSKTIEFTITAEGSRDLSLVNPSALMVNFDSMGRSNKEVVTTRNTWKSKTNSYSATLTGFNWYNNGWIDDSDGYGSYLSFTNGASAEIPIGNLSLNTGQTQYSFEMRFRIRNAQKYATLVTEYPKYRYYTDPNDPSTANELGTEMTLDDILEAGYTVMLDEDGNKVMNEANTTEKVTESTKNIALSYFNNGKLGFCIGTQEAYFNAGGKVVNVRYKENEIINITFVIDKPNDVLSIYLNGILSGAVNLTGISAITMENSRILINSTYCDFDLYKLRFYRVALTMPEVIHNYIADIKNKDLYDENQLADVNDATKLSYQKLVAYNEEHPDAPTMPYVVIDMSNMTDGKDFADELPYKKGNKRAVRIEFTNPTADYLLETGQITPYQYYTHCPSYTANNVELNVQGTSSQIYPRRNFKAAFKKAKNWNFTKGELADQSIAEAHTLESGQTISKKWHMDSEELSTNKFTWKIDYMESSGSYNTGFANLMGSGVYNKHPLEDLNINGLDASVYRTSVYGFPFLAFHKNAQGVYTYIGRYNMNLDKGSNEYYGFEEEIEHPYVTKQKTVPVTDPETEEPVIDENTGEPMTETVTYHPTIKKVSECWELRDNQGTWCSWRYPTAEMRAAGFGALMSGSTPEDPKIEVAQHFEARYHPDADQFEYAQNIILGKENEDDYSADIGGNTNAAASAYVRNKLSNLEVLFNWLDSTDTTGATDETFDAPKTFEVGSKLSNEDAVTAGVTYEERTEGGVLRTYGTFTKDSVEYRRQKFYNEFDLHLDKHYCTIYFIMTELLLCYDSRGKNMMIASWGPRAQGGEYIWYPIFYDIDTQLGLNNVGAKLWDYDEDCSENRTFSTATSVLWNNFYDVFKESIITAYRGLRNGKLTYGSIEGAYTCNPNVFKNSYAMRGKRPVLAIGLDEYYKYVLPTVQTWRNQEGKMVTANYLYACQGDRILSRELLINNRLLYMDSKWLGGDFTITSGAMAGIMFRSTGNQFNDTSDIYLDNAVHEANQVNMTYPVPFFDSTPEYYVTPYLNFYITTFVDENVSQNPEPYDPAKHANGIPTIVSDSVLTGYRSGTVDQQLNYFAGSQYISSIGDLSTKYVNQVKYPNCPRLLDITLGSDIPGYFSNEVLNPFELYIEPKVDKTDESTQKPLLQKIILSNLRRLDAFIDARNAVKLQEFRALGTQLPYALFAEGAPLRAVHLPSTVTELRFTQNKDLTKIIRTTPTVVDMKIKATGEIDSASGLSDRVKADPYAYEAVYHPLTDYAGLFVDGLTNFNFTTLDKDVQGAGSLLGVIDFEGDAMGYDSYEILRNAVVLKNKRDRLKIRMDSVVWTPYTMVEEGTEKAQNVDYFYLTDHNTYEPYGSRTTWDNDVLNERVYTFSDPDNKRNIVTNLDLLDLFYEDYHSVEGTSAINQFTNNNESMNAQATVPTLTGQLFVNNDSEHPIKEADLANHYGVLWPNLTIRANYIEESYLLRYVQILDGSGKESVITVSRYDKEHVSRVPSLIATIPYKENHDFLGWAREPEGINFVSTYDFETGISTVDQEALAELTFSNEHSSYTLYAIFELHQYPMTFYNGDNSTFIKPITFNQVITAPALTEFVPYLDASDLAFDKKYQFTGWSMTRDGDPINLSAYKSTRSYTFYPLFKVVSVYDDVLSSDYYTVTPMGQYTDRYGDDTYNVSNGLQIDLKPGIRLSGKICLPVEVDGQPITIVGDFGASSAGGSYLTHVFFSKTGTNKIRVFSGTAFTLQQNLTYVEFPRDLRELGNQALRQTYKLGLVDEEVDMSGTKLAFIASNAFGDAFNISTGVRISIKLPGSVRYIQENAWSYCSGPLGKLTIGSTSDPLRAAIELPANTISSQNEGYEWTAVELFMTSSARNALFEAYTDETTIALKLGTTVDKLTITTV